jgi:hypothetical protein
MFLNQHQSIGTHAKFPVADFFHLLCAERQGTMAIINENKVITCCLIFIEMYFQKIGLKITLFLRSRYTHHL